LSDSVEKRTDFNLIRYSNCWEDADILVDALEPGPGKKYLSIASAGDNTLALLASNPKLVVAFDVSAVQLACLELRSKAFASLDYETVLGFLGVRQCPDDRLAIYREKIRPALSPNARGFWDAHPRYVENGAIFFGKFENYFALFRRYALSLVHSRKKVAQLLTKKEREEQRSFYDQKWDTWRWRMMFRIFFSRYIMAKAGRDAEFFKYVEGKVAERILHRVEYALKELPTHSNPYLNFILTGNFGEALPYYLHRENFQKIRDNLGSLELFQGRSDQVLKKYNLKFDAFNLSDIFEYMDETLFKETAEEILQYSSPGARFAYWNMLAPRSLAVILPKQVRGLEARATELLRRDRAFFYQAFHLDEVR